MVRQRDVALQREVSRREVESGDDFEAPILGRDSRGTPLFPGDSCLALSGKRFYGFQLERVSQLHADMVCRIDSPEDISELLATVTFQEVGSPRSLEPLRAKPPEFWQETRGLGKQVQQAIDAYGSSHATVTEKKELLRDKDLEISPDRFLINMERKENGWQLTFLVEGGDFLYSYVANEPAEQQPILSISQDGAPVILFVGNDDALHHVQLHMQYQSPEIIPLDRVKDPEDIVRILRKTWPWLETDDLTSDYGYQLAGGSVSSHSEVDFSSPAQLDAVRLARLYPYNETNDLHQDLTIAEILFLATRNYAYLVEFVYWLEGLAGGSGIRLEGSNPAQRKIEVLRFLASVESELKRLTDERAKFEQKILGKTLPDTFRAYIDRFASGETIMGTGDEFGLHQNGLAMMITHDKERRPRYRIVSDSRDTVIGAFVDIVMHENGHHGERHAPDWTHREMWNEWNKVILTRMLANDDPKFLANYQYHPETGERGGAWTLHDAVVELVRIADSHELTIEPPHTSDLETDGENSIPVTGELVAASALLTAALRKQTGWIDFEGKQYPAFGTLFNHMYHQMGMNLTFDALVADFSDQAYYDQSASDDTSQRCREQKEYHHESMLAAFLDGLTANIDTFLANKQAS